MMADHGFATLEEVDLNAWLTRRTIASVPTTENEWDMDCISARTSLALTQAASTCTTNSGRPGPPERLEPGC